MNVADVIKELQACPQDAELTVEFMDIKRIVIWPDGVVIETEGE